MDLRLIDNLIAVLPGSGEWTAEERERWLLALTAIVDLLIDVVPDDKPAVEYGT